MKAVIFDFDGTIADSVYVWNKVDRDFFARRGMEVPEDYVDAISTMSFYNGAVYTKEKYSIKESVGDIMEEWNTHALEEYENNVRLKPYVRNYIYRLRQQGIKIGLATASNPEFYLPVLKREGIMGYFDAFADGSDKNVRNKDFPDIYLLCAERLKTEPSQCRVYEDVIKGVLSAKSAGMEVIAVYDKSNESRWEEIKASADAYIMDFSQL